jgi:hypothetical protein
MFEIGRIVSGKEQQQPVGRENQNTGRSKFDYNALFGEMNNGTVKLDNENSTLPDAIDEATGEPVYLSADPKSRFIVNQVEKEVSPLFNKKNKPIDEKLIT